MNILERYIGKAVLLGTVIVMLVLLTLLGVFELMKELDEVGRGSYAISDAMLSAVLSLPRKLFEVFPVTALVGSLMGLGTLASNGELTAMRAAGVSVRKIVIAVLKTGFFMLLFVFLIGEFVGPISEEYVRKVKVEKQQQAVTLKSKYGFWARDGNEYVNIRKILPGSQLEDIYIYDVGPDKKLQLATHAAKATYADGKWTLQDIAQTSLQQDQTHSRVVETASWGSMIDPELLSIIVVEPTMLPAWGLYNYMSFMQQNGQDATLYQVAFWTKIVTPLTTVVMLFLAVPFVLGSLREVGVGQRVFVGTIIGTVFYALNQSFAYMAVIYSIEPVLATSVPALVMFFVGLWYLRRID